MHTLGAPVWAAKRVMKNRGISAEGIVHPLSNVSVVN